VLLIDAYLFIKAGEIIISSNHQGPVVDVRVWSWYSPQHVKNGLDQDDKKRPLDERYLAPRKKAPVRHSMHVQPRKWFP
jgi:hypothetical protein